MAMQTKHTSQPLHATDSPPASQNDTRDCRRHAPSSVLTSATIADGDAVESIDPIAGDHLHRARSRCTPATLWSREFPSRVPHIATVATSN